MSALYPYLDEIWREQAIRRGFDEMWPPMLILAGPTPLSVRADWRDAGGKPATTPERLIAEALAPFGTGTAILNCLYGTSAAFSEDIQAAFCKALNDWIAHEWLDRDPRLRASIVVPLTNTDMAVAEIERRAVDPRFVQVLPPVSKRSAAGPAAELADLCRRGMHRLPIGMLAAARMAILVTGVGWPGSYTEDYVNQAVGFQSALSSLLSEGVFAKFPDLTIVLMESGVSWLPAYIWRFTKFWKGLRSEIPWVSDPPGEIIRERVRLTMQLFDAPPDPGGLIS